MIRVVIADDVDDVRLVVRLALECDGRFEVVHEARDGGEAVRVCGEHQPDALVLDVGMPCMTGVEALPRLRAAAPRTRIVVFTAHRDPTLTRSLLLSGASSVVSKGEPISILAEHLAAAVEG